MPDRVLSAHLDATLAPRLLTGPDGRIMNRCEIDPRPGGAIRHDWCRVDGSAGFHLEATITGMDRPRHVRHVERLFLPDPTPETRVKMLFPRRRQEHVHGHGAVRRQPGIMKRMLATGMTEGMEAGHARLDALLSAP